MDTWFCQDNSGVRWYLCGNRATVETSQRGGESRGCRENAMH